MSDIDSFIADLLGGNSAANPIFTQNESERDGNSNDLLFTINQPTLSVAGGTTFTDISPYTAVSDASQGKLSLAVLVWVAIAAFAGWFLLRKF